MMKGNRMGGRPQSAKFLRKMRTSISLDVKAQQLLARMAEAEHRSESGFLNKLIYEEAERRGLVPPAVPTP